MRGDSTRLSSLGRAPDGPSLWDDERQRLAIRRVVLFLVLCLVASMVVIVPSSVPAAAAPTTPRICSSETVSGDLPAWGVGSIGWTTLGDIWVPQGATLTMQGSVAVNSRSISGWSANVYFRPNSGNRHLSGSGPNTYAVGGSWTNSGASRDVKVEIGHQGGGGNSYNLTYTVSTGQSGPGCTPGEEERSSSCNRAGPGVNSGRGTAGDPVSTELGNMVLSATDLAVPLRVVSSWCRVGRNNLARCGSGWSVGGWLVVGVGQPGGARCT